MKAAQHQRLLAASLAITRALLLLAVMLLWPENRVWAFAPAPHLASAETSHATPSSIRGNVPLAVDDASGCCVAAEGLGDLTAGEIKAIQGVVDEAGRPLDVVGSAARGARRGVGTDLPIGKGPGTQSDIDYIAPPSSHPYFNGLEGRLPSLDPETGIIPGSPNPNIGPSIRFEPGASPYYVPGQ